MIRVFSIVLLVTLFNCLAVAQPYSIGQLSTTINDPTRSNRAIGIEVFYPANSNGNNVPVATGELFPVIIIGHGFSMNYDAYRNFWEKLVPLGYVVALPKTEVGPIPFPSHGDFGRDMAFTLTWLQQQNTLASSLFYTKLSNTSAFMGHSMGGGCSYIAAEQMPSVTAIANFAAAETNPSAVTAAGNVSVPALVFAASKDNVAPPADNQVDMYNALASSNKWLVNLTDASHCGFANSNTLCEFGELTVCAGCSFIDRQDQHQLQFSILVPWLHFFLKGQCDQWPVFNALMQQPVGFTVVEDQNITLPQAGIVIQGSTALCTVDTTYLLGSGGASYLWSNNDTAASTFVTSAGTYQLVVTDDRGCTDTSEAVITASNVIKPVIAVSNTTLCAGDTVSINVQQQYSSYQWSNGDTAIAIDNITANIDLSVTVTNANGCSTASDTVSIVFRTPNIQPILTVSNDTMIAIGGNILAWYYNGSKLGNYSGSFLYPLTEGTYTVEVADSFGCKVLSDAFEYVEDTVNTSVTDIDLLINVYPNPTKGKIVVEVLDEVAKIQIMDLNGKVLTLPSDIRSEGRIIDLSQLESGLYIVRIESKGKTYLRKIVK